LGNQGVVLLNCSLADISPR